MTAATEPETKTALQRFTVQDSAIATMREQYMPLTIAGMDDKIGAERVHKARMVCVKARTGTDKVRKDLNAEAKKWIDTVNGEAKRITALLAPIEQHLVDEEERIEAEVQAERTRKWREEEAARQAAEVAAEAARQQRIKEENDRLAAERVELARLRAEMEAQQRQAQAEAMARQDAENARLAAERASIEESRRSLHAAQEAERARQKAEQDRIDSERRAQEVERQRLADAEAACLRKIEEDRLAAERAERERVESEARTVREEAERVERERRQAEERESARLRAEALRPDADKLAAVASIIRGIDVPDMSTVEGQAAAARVNAILDRAAGEIRDIAVSLAPQEPMPLSPDPMEDETDVVPF